MSEFGGNRLPQSVYWRRRIIAASACVGALASSLWVGTEVVNALKHNDDPIPAGCTTNLRPGQDYWAIADKIDEHTSDETGEISWKLGRTNPDMAAGELQPGPISVPEEYCSIVEQPDFNQ